MSLGTILTLAITPAVLSAERIEFFVGPFEPVIWVEDLEALAEDGTVNERLHTFASRLNEQQIQELQTFLNLRLDVDLITLSQFTYWQVGERFLDRMGQVVQTDSFLNGSLALRSALIAASVDGDGITSLEVMQAYPLDVIQLNFPLLQQIIQENRRFFADQDKVLAQFRAVGEAEATAFSSVIPDSVLPTRAGSYLWEQESLTFQNPLREGTIPFDIYLPQQTAESTPVIVFSHGVASGRNAFVYLAQHLASHGYAVVVPQHDDDSQKYSQFLAGVDRPPNPMTLISRPRDISLVLDELEQLAQTQQDYANLAIDNVGVLGHSLGGFTVLAVAGAEFNFEKIQQNCSLAERNRPSLNPSLLVQCDLIALEDQAPFQLQDDRIRAVFALNPPTSLFFGETGLAQIEIPTFLVASMADIVVPAIPEQIDAYRWLQTNNRYLVAIENATHFTFLEGDLTEGALPLPSALLGPDPQQARPYLSALSLAFFNRHLLGQIDAERFLTQPYLDSLGTDPFQFTIVRNLPSD
ncbi:MAG: alpha/beta hydrolase [Cyanobacteria bacterium P01_F01_bin.86]